MKKKTPLSHQFNRPPTPLRFRRQGGVHVCVCVKGVEGSGLIPNSILAPVILLFSGKRDFKKRPHRLINQALLTHCALHIYVSGGDLLCVCVCEVVRK